MNKVRVRYAPSPTGYLHIGGARTALYNYLFAKHYNGEFILRTEDTDIERNVEGGEASQIDNLEWLGIQIDESPRKPNIKYAPYRQMERLEIYHYYADLLVKQGYAYKCFCSSEDLQSDYQRQTDSGIAATRYNRKCLGLNNEKIIENEKNGLPFSVRLKVPSDRMLIFNDLIRGEVHFNSKDFGDFVIIKANGIPTYNFAVVIDDHLMEISHVFRGEEHLSNTPKQLLLYDLFGWQAPQFGHMTLIVNDQHKKLSKRDNSVIQFISQYREEGYLPEAIMNFLALLGWSPKTNEEILGKDDLIRDFDESRLSKAPSMFDQNKLNWLNGCYIKKLSDEKLLNLCKPFLENSYDLTDYNSEKLLNLIILFRDQLICGKQIVSLLSPFFHAPNLCELEEEMSTVLSEESAKLVCKSFYDKLIKQVELTAEDLKRICKETQEETKIKGKNLYLPLRIVLSGMLHGSDFTGLVLNLGKKEVLSRLEKFI